MSDEDSWCLLDSAVYSRLVGVSSIQEKVELLETTIYDQASRLFGHPVPPLNGSKGLNRRSPYVHKIMHREKLFKEPD